MDSDQYGCFPAINFKDYLAGDSKTRLQTAAVLYAEYAVSIVWRSMDQGGRDDLGDVIRYKPIDVRDRKTKSCIIIACLLSLSSCPSYWLTADRSRENCLSICRSHIDGYVVPKSLSPFSSCQPMSLALP